ncbi:uncharacterized protein LOC143618251 [Bidens hawaiensis]|uniref:uncharacterized protein LOC143618251 n=1 Tax=Bidens hawaiensis TaxID=980011 RepID=UPI00404B26DE
MAIILRFVDAKGMIRERFLDLVHVHDTLSATLKTSLFRQLLHYEFDVKKIRWSIQVSSKRYDGASNMRGEWNGLQARVRKDCRYAYYVHCFAHRLQLALVYASRENIIVHNFFNQMVSIINVVCASSKRHDELQITQEDEVIRLLELGEIKSGSGLNQVGTLQRAGDTRWRSHYVFTSTFDKQFHELDSRCNDHTIELLSLSSSLDSKKINVDEICLLVEKYYPEDFTEPERTHLRDQLVVFNVEMTNNTKLRGVSCISDLCKYLVDTQKCETYYWVDRLIRLILTLPVSTATTERGFSAMKIFKNYFRNKMSDEYLANSLVIYIEKEIAETFDSESIINEFKDLKGRRAAL